MRITNVCKIALLGAIALSAFAQTTTVTGSPKVLTAEPVSGTLTITPVFPASTSAPERVMAAPVTIQFTGGTFSIALLPTDAMAPSGQKYRVTYTIKDQTTANGHRINGASSNPCFWTVPSSPSSIDVGQIESCDPTVVAPVEHITTDQILATGAGLGQAICWSGISWLPGNCLLSGYSMDLTQPSGSDAGLLQKVDDAFTYLITSVSCSTDRGTVAMNLDIRPASAPNAAGTNVLGSAITCGSAANTVVFVSPPVSVPAGSAVSLDPITVLGSPGVVRAHISRQQ